MSWRTKPRRRTLYQDVVDWFANALTPQGADLLHDADQIVNKGHGRVEPRQ
jgi:hypothetical protein